eukprot:753336-Hanusia_phi.AAC.5
MAAGRDRGVRHGSRRDLPLFLPLVLLLSQQGACFSIRGTSSAVGSPPAASKLLCMLKNFRLASGPRTARSPGLQSCSCSNTPVESQADRYLREMNTCKLLSDNFNTVPIYWASEDSPVQYRIDTSKTIQFQKGQVVLAADLDSMQHACFRSLLNKVFGCDMEDVSITCFGDEDEFFAVEKVIFASSPARMFVRGSRSGVWQLQASFSRTWDGAGGRRTSFLHGSRRQGSGRASCFLLPPPPSQDEVSRRRKEEEERDRGEGKKIWMRGGVKVGGADAKLEDGRDVEEEWEAAEML